MQYKPIMSTIRTCQCIFVLIEYLWADKYKLSEKMYYQRVNLLEMTENCVMFYTGTECTLVLCSNIEK